MIKSVVSDQKGSFELFDIPLGNYFLVAWQMGYEDAILQNLKVQDGMTLSSGVIKLKTKTVDLQSVERVALRKLIEVRADRIIFNPDVLISSAGNSAWELLQTALGIFIDSNNIITMKGKSGVNIYTDDRPLYLQGDDLANALKAIPSNAV